MTAVYVITGVMAVGKSTVADVLARRFERGVHLRGDVFRRFIVAGRAPMTPDLDDEGVAQLRLRRELAARTADDYWRAGFDVVVQDALIGTALPQFVDSLTATPVYVVVLTADVRVIAARERDRPKTGYGAWTAEALQEVFERETPRIGLWLDTSLLTPTETVDEILRRRDDALVRPQGEP